MPINKKLWRNSASLIILAKNTCKLDVPNYRLAVLKRPATMSFMPNAVVFPGGTCEKADESHDWLEHFRECGVSERKMSEVTEVKGLRPDIFRTLGNSPMKREISLRITAIREAFEELGVLICRKKNQLEDDCDYGSFIEEYDREKWQSMVDKDPGQFINLCREHELVPDIWKLYEWSAWLTPALIPKRFQTAFFVVSVEAQPTIQPCGREVLSAYWETPSNLLKSFNDEKIDLVMPQIYEIMRIGKYTAIENLTKFAKLRNSQGITLQYPTVFSCADGLLHVCPGDDLYPKDPDKNQVDYDVHQFKNRTFAELRAMSNKMHRCEQYSSHNTIIILNFELPNGHISPIAKL